MWVHIGPYPLQYVSRVHLPCAGTARSPAGSSVPRDVSEIVFFPDYAGRNVRVGGHGMTSDWRSRWLGDEFRMCYERVPSLMTTTQHGDHFRSVRAQAADLLLGAVRLEDTVCRSRTVYYVLD